VIGWLAQRHALESQFPLTVQDVVSQGAGRASRCCAVRGETGDVSARWSAWGWHRWRKRRLRRSPAAVPAHAVCRVIVQQAPLVMLDEPFTGLMKRPAAS
jgi:zinc/manganese transport system ATP-binding protein